jgi:glutathione S-transferase
MVLPVPYPAGHIDGELNALRKSLMADELALYTNPMSRGRIARWMLEKIGQPYKVEVLDYASTMKAPAYLAINPMGKVPALRHGDAVVTETAAICAYLADAFPQSKLAPPPGDRLRAPYYRWLFFSAGPVEAATSNKALGFVVPPERERMIGYGSFPQVMETLEAAVSRGDYLLGSSFTAADVYVGSQIGFGMMFGSMEKRPAFEKYWQKISSRPAMTRAKELDDAQAAELKKAASSS